MPKFKVNLSVNSLDNLLSSLKEYRDKVSSLPSVIVDTMTNRAEQKIEEKLNTVTDKDGNVDARAGSYQFGNSGFAFLEGSQAGYLEFGTGVMGEQNSHPLAAENGWEYGSGEKIFTTKDGKIGWVYRESGTGKWIFTEGIAAQRIVYDTAQEISKEAEEVAKGAMS